MVNDQNPITIKQLIEQLNANRNHFVLLGKKLETMFRARASADIGPLAEELKQTTIELRNLEYTLNVVRRHPRVIDTQNIAELRARVATFRRNQDSLRETFRGLSPDDAFPEITKQFVDRIEVFHEAQRRTEQFRQQVDALEANLNELQQQELDSILEYKLNEIRDVTHILITHIRSSIERDDVH